MLAHTSLVRCQSVVVRLQIVPASWWIRVSLDYRASAKPFLSKRAGNRVKYRRFATAAEATRYAEEVLPDLRKHGALMRFNSDDVRRPYNDSDYAQ
jgi:hypothetical protein